MFVHGTQVVLASTSLFMALLFAIFVAVMFYDQVSCILDNMSTIDKLKHKRALKEGKKVEQEESRSRTYWQSICEVMSGRFDKGFDIWWLIPTDIEYPLYLENEYY